jgi:hypothetical protein
LFYVALTRAKKTCTVTYVHSDGDQNGQNNYPSIFISDIPIDMVEAMQFVKGELVKPNIANAPPVQQMFKNAPPRLPPNIKQITAQNVKSETSNTALQQPVVRLPPKLKTESKTPQQASVNHKVTEQGSDQRTPPSTQKLAVRLPPKVNTSRVTENTPQKQQMSTPEPVHESNTQPRNAVRPPPKLPLKNIPLPPKRNVAPVSHQIETLSTETEEPKVSPKKSTLRINRSKSITPSQVFTPPRSQVISQFISQPAEEIIDVDNDDELMGNDKLFDPQLGTQPASQIATQEYSQDSFSQIISQPSSQRSQKKREYEDSFLDDIFADVDYSTQQPKDRKRMRTEDD